MIKDCTSDNIECYECGNYGHMSRNCPKFENDTRDEDRRYRRGRGRGRRRGRGRGRPQRRNSMSSEDSY